MNKEVINIHGDMILYMALPITGDGACLLYGLSYLLYGTQVMARYILEEIVDYVVRNWKEFCIMTMTQTVIII